LFCPHSTNMETFYNIPQINTTDKVSNNTDENPFAAFFMDAMPNDFDVLGSYAESAVTPTFAPSRSKFTMPFSNTGNLIVLSEEESNATQRGSWKTISINKSIMQDDGEMSLFLETRTNKNGSEKMDTDLFSSISYELRLKAEGAFTNNTPFLLSRLQVVDPSTGEEIRKNNKTILSGACESTLSPHNKENRVFETVIKFKFTDVSYHHDRRPFALRVSLFLNSNTDEPAVVKQSEPIMVFARKKQNVPATKKSGTKRKIEEEAAPVKSRKTSEVMNRPHPEKSEEDFNEFALKLEALFAQVAQMCPQDKSNAINRILQKMYEVDSEYFQPQALMQSFME
jgi:hypothetical protein